ncbi:MAG: DUF1294 domain-containing protein [Tissierellia bacterium]|nr:DUF1294 domain-containing protein [Tissierellia bacterium]
MIILKSLTWIQKAVLIYIFAINILSLILFFYDKSIAKTKRGRKMRIREKNLLYAAIAGGSAGALLGMYIFKHKTKKALFSIGLPIIFLIHLFLFYKLLFYI